MGGVFSPLQYTNYTNIDSDYKLVFAHIGFLIKSLLALLKHDVQRAFNSPLVSPVFMNGTTASQSTTASTKPAKSPPPGPTPPVPASAPPVPPSTAQPFVRPPATSQPAPTPVNGTQTTKNKKRNEPPVDPVTMYESVKNRIAALEEEEVLEEEEERRFGVLFALFLCLVV